MEKEGRKKTIFLILAGVGLYLLSTGVAYAAFSYLNLPFVSPSLLSPIPVEEARSKIDLSAPKTEACPLTGAKFSKDERKIWEQRRPLAVMIENHQESRPQSGLSKADVVYEAVAEGGITRFLAVFYCGAAAVDIQVGPVRSARTHFVDLASAYGDYPLYAHVGGANDFGGFGETALKVRALEQIQSYGWKLYNDLDSMSLSFPVYWRDYERLGRVVATEHTMYSSTDRLWKVAADRGLTNVNKEGEAWDEDFTNWEFKDDAKEGEREAKSPEFGFWEDYGDYNVKWEYTPLSNDYRRLNGGSVHKDRNDDGEVRAKTVVVVFMKEQGPVDKNLHLYYQTKGSGKAVVFQDGQAIIGTWAKKDREEMMVFKDASGKQIKFNKGPAWIEVLPVGADITY